jgi:hypothetical protein
MSDPTYVFIALARAISDFEKCNVASLLSQYAVHIFGRCLDHTVQPKKRGSADIQFDTDKQRAYQTVDDSGSHPKR